MVTQHKSLLTIVTYYTQGGITWSLDWFSGCLGYHLSWSSCYSSSMSS